MKKRLLAPLAGVENLRIDELVDLAARIIPPLAGPQMRYKVTEIPDARTVRYYVSEGLVDPPLGSSGPAALYGYKHLLQLVLLKVMQARNLPIRHIRETTSQAGVESLEEMLERLVQEEDRFAMRRAHGSSPASLAGESARDYLRSLLEKPASRPATSGWERYELHPGVELHVRRDVAMPSTPSFPSALASRVRAILDKLRRSTP